MYTQNQITTCFDENINDIWENHVRFEVILNDGTKVYQDDGIYKNKISSWIRLRNYCIENNLYINNFKIGFRDNVKSLPENKDGYFFRKMAKCFFGGSVKQQYIIGYQEDDILKCSIVAVPEIIVEIEEVRNIDLEDLSLISKEVVKTNHKEK